MKFAVISLITAIIVALLATPYVRTLAIRLGVMDHPDPRRVHKKPTPRWGGIAIWLGVVIALVVVGIVDHVTGQQTVTGSKFFTQLNALVVGATVIAMVGLIDDKYQLSAAWQALTMIAVSWVVTYFGVRVDFITNPFGEHGTVYMGKLAVPLTVIWLFGVTKTIDLVDGLDGLAAGVCAIASAALAALALMAGNIPIAVLCAAVTGASLGFLRYNYPPAKIFMGTVGAQFMGFLIAGAAVIGAFKVAAAFSVIVPLLALGIPLFDAAFAVARRAASGKPVYLPDRGHIHHRLLDAGLTQSQAILVIYTATFLLSAAALIIVFTLR